MKYLLIILLTLSIPLAQARKWERVRIPGATCGDGKPYAIFLSQKQKHNSTNRKLAVEFMGGGVCWSMNSCYGPRLRTWVHPMVKLPVFSTLTTRKSPLNDHDFIYFPYCTGDVFAGKHVGKYAWGSKIHHTGFTNVQKSLRYIERMKLVNFKKLEDLVLYGSSAGGIASLIHANTFESYLSKETKRTVIADSPGLHFGHDFWSKFTLNQIVDFQDAFTASNLFADFNDGMVAPYFHGVCEKMEKWSIGILQGSKDIVMSSLFGEISPDDHEVNVYSKEGIINSIKGSLNCHAWIKKTKMHTFLLFKQASNMEVLGTSALSFFNKVHQRTISGSMIE
ncbi:MAG: hypothetical protein HN576_05780 [Bacteriovoracaceae bacterium]|jgi:hypothetical protein|nr:hypothetical protein [Bacteriovoracaceae bacterium]